MTDAATDEYERKFMAPGESVVFREKVVSRGAFKGAIVFLLVFGIVGLALVAAGAAGAVPTPVGFVVGPVSAVFGAMMGVLGVMFSVFRVMITTSHVHVHFGFAKRKIPFSAIESIRAVQLKGFRQGKVSVGFDGVVRTWVGHAPSGRGVEIAYAEASGRKHVMTIGSDEADRFVETVERARSRPPEETEMRAPEPDGRVRVVRETALARERLDDGSDERQVAERHVGEEMMLDVEVDASAKKAP